MIKTVTSVAVMQCKGALKTEPYNLNYKAHTLHHHHMIKTTTSVAIMLRKGASKRNPHNLNSKSKPHNLNSKPYTLNPNPQDQDRNEQCPPLSVNCRMHSALFSKISSLL